MARAPDPRPVVVHVALPLSRGQLRRAPATCQLARLLKTVLTWRAILSQAGGFEPSGLRVSEERTELWNPHRSLKLAPLVQVDDDQLFEKPRGRTRTGQAEREIGCWCHRRALLVPHRDEQLYARVSDSAQETWPMRRQLRPATLPER